jgi:2-polyprenyl-3-methyl-5-hydroxy-6-metoxy-1,4-benzoquinol methylase
MKLTEFHSGYRVYSVDALKQIPFERNTNDFHFDTEIIVQFHAKNFRIKELPIPVYYGDEICRVNGMKYALMVAVSVIQYKFHEKGLRHYGKYAITKRYSYKQDRHSSHGQVIRLIPLGGQKILDVGCGPSDLAKFIKKNGNEIVGIDKYLSGDPDPSISKVIAMDLDADFKLDYGREFDVILFLDLLEHLRNPDAALQKARSYLKPGGRVIISIPNVAHWSVRLGLLLGRFNYGDKGILDKTHLRFFTLRTLRHMVRDANYRIVKLSATPLPLLDAFPVFRWFPFRLIHWVDVALVKVWKRLFGYQFVVVLEDTFGND